MGKFWDSNYNRPQTYWSDLDPSKKFDTLKEAQEYDAQLQVLKFKERTEAKQAADAEGEETFRNLTAPGALPPQGGVGMPQEQADLSRKPVSLPNPSQFAKGTPTGSTKAGTAIREEMAFEGIEENLTEQKDQDVIKRLTEAGRFDDVVSYVKQIKQASPEANRFSGGRGSEIKYTIDNPEEVKEYEIFLQSKLDQVDAAGKPMLTPEDKAAVEGLIHTAGRNIFEASRNYDTLTRNIAQRLTVLQKGIPFKVEEAKKKKDALIKKESELKDVSADTAATIQSAKTAATEFAKLKSKYALAAEGLYDIGKTEADTIMKAGRMYDTTVELGELIQAGNLDIFDLTPAGDIKNPRGKMLIKVLNEFYARPLSGAAINNTEWKDFRAQLMNKKYIATEKGRKAVLLRFKDLQKDANVVAGLITKDDKWLSRLKRFEPPESGEEEETENTQKPPSLSDSEWEELQELEKELGK